MRRGGRGLLALVLAAAVVALGVLLVRRSGADRPLAQATDPSTPAVTSVVVRLAGPVRLSAQGTDLVLDLPVRTDAAVPVTVAPAARPAPGFTSRGPVAVPAGRSATLRLRWDGPDCEHDVPDRILVDLALRVQAPGRRLGSVLDTSAADGVLRQSWVTGCAIEPTPPGPTSG